MSHLSSRDWCQQRDISWVNILTANKDTYRPLCTKKLIDINLMTTRRNSQDKEPQKQNNPIQCIVISSSEDETTLVDVKEPTIPNENLILDKNEVIGENYRIVKVVGQGAFGKVVEAEKQGKLYAIKVLKDVSRNVSHGNEETEIIRSINQKDPNDEFGIIRYIESFVSKGHFCMVFESLGRNLYEVMVTNKRGYSIKLIQSFFKQILVAVGFIHKMGYTHTDLKPENILFANKEFRTRLRNPISEEGELLIEPVSTKIKIIDFGNAVHDKKYHCNLINTRQYRAPEVILGCSRWNNSSDVWSIGCIIVEFLFGKVAFPTRQNHEHLLMIETLCGKFPSWMHNRSQSLCKLFNNDGKLLPLPSHFDKHYKFGQIIQNKQIISRSKQLNDLLFKCLQIDPKKRISCQQALKHKFFATQYF